MTTFDPTEATVEAVHEAMRAGDLTSRELVGYYLDRIDAYDRTGPELNSIVTINDDARERAAELDEAFAEEGVVGPLHGIPVLVKDQAETAGLRTTFGSAVFDDYVPEADAAVVARLKRAGAVVLAKTTLCDWAASWFGYSSAVGRTKNPYALDRDPGGSSAGTGAGVAANLGAVGIGEDTGGSIRLPAGYCNLFGIRVTTGLISRAGLSPLVSRQDTPGPMTRTVTDMAHVLDAIVGYDDADEWTGTTAAVPDRPFTDCLDADALDSARVGVLRWGFGDDDDPEAAPVTAVVEDALATVADAGATLVDPVEILGLGQKLDETSLYTLQGRRDVERFLAERDVPADTPRNLPDSATIGVTTTPRTPPGAVGTTGPSPGRAPTAPQSSAPLPRDEPLEVLGRHRSAGRVAVGDERRDARDARLPGGVERRPELLAERLVVQRRPNRRRVGAGVRREFDEQGRVADVPARCPERVEDGLVEGQPRLVVPVVAQEGGDELCGQRVDVTRYLDGHLDVVVVGETADVLARLFEVVLVFPVVDRVVETPVGPALLCAEVERVPVDPQRVVTRRLVPVERHPTEVAERTDVVRVHRDRLVGHTPPYGVTAKDSRGPGQSTVCSSPVSSADSSPDASVGSRRSPLASPAAAAVSSLTPATVNSLASRPRRATRSATNSFSVRSRRSQSRLSGDESSSARN